MTELVIYFNERCLPINCSNEIAMIEGIRSLVKTFEMVLERHASAKIGFLYEDWTRFENEFSLPAQLKRALEREKTRYQRFMKKVKILHKTEFEFTREIQYEGQTAVGFGLAELAAFKWTNGWSISYGADHEKWCSTNIPVARFILDVDGNIIGPSECEVSNLAHPDHIAAFDLELRDWGEVVAASSVLDYLHGHPIVMYSAPREHNPPHVHLRWSTNHEGDIGKYRIADGQRETGIPKWDSEMKEWILKNQAYLLKCWDRCQRGGHPYSLP